jgi:hypothetical protein
MHPNLRVFLLFPDVLFAQQAKAPVEVLEGIEMVRIELDEVFNALAEGKIT